MKKLLLCLLLLFGVKSLQAQTILLDQKVDTSEYYSSFGPNQRHYVQVFYRMGTAVRTQSDEVATKTPAGLTFGVGSRYKLKITSILAVGLVLDYRSQQVNLSSGGLSPFPDTLFSSELRIHQSSRFQYQEIGLGGYVRVNFDRFRGDYIGKFLDIGASPRYVLGNSYVTIDEEPNGVTKRTSYSNLPYVQPLNVQAFARLGINFIALEAHYRFTPFWKSAYPFPELPRWQFTLSFNGGL